MAEEVTLPEQTVGIAIQLAFEQLNRTTTNIKAYHIDSAFMTPTDGWSITLYEHTDRSLMFDLEMQPIQIFINGNLQVVGRVDSSEVGGNGHAVTLEGRDYIADLTECNVDPSIVIKEGMTLEQSILLAASPLGVNNVVGDRFRFRNIQTGVNIQTKEADTKFLETKMGDYKANPGEGVFEFLNRIVQRHGATIQPTDKRDTLAIVRPDYGQEPRYKIIRYGDNPAGVANNILSATAKRDFSQFPTHVLVTGRSGGKGQQKAVAAINSESTLDELREAISKDPSATTLEDHMELFLPARNRSLLVTKRLKPGEENFVVGALYRLLYIKDELSKTSEQLNHIMLRNTYERVKNCLQYQVTLKGHEDPDTGATYATDTVVEVTDEICGVNERLWIEHRTFDYSETSGQTTTLTCWRLGSFLI